MNSISCTLLLLQTLFSYWFLKLLIFLLCPTVFKKNCTYAFLFFYVEIDSHLKTIARKWWKKAINFLWGHPVYLLFTRLERRERTTSTCPQWGWPGHHGDGEGNESKDNISVIDEIVWHANKLCNCKEFWINNSKF